MPGRKFILAASLASGFTLALGLALRASGDWRLAFLLGSVEAAGAATGTSLLDQLMASFIPGSQKAADAALGTTLSPPAGGAASGGPAGAAGGDAGFGRRLPEPAPPCTGPDCAASEPGGSAEAFAGPPPEEGPAGTAAGADMAAVEEQVRLELIRMREREKGETRNYGDRPAASTALQRRAGPPDSAALESSFGGFIQKLKGRAAAAAPAGKALGGPRRGGGEAAEAEGADSPILTRNGGIDPKYDSPTLRALQNVNKGSAHSFGMSRDPGLEDGSKDHAGKNFDGNQATYGAVPIEEKSSSMGRRQITVAPEERPAR